MKINRTRLLKYGAIASSLALSVFLAGYAWRHYRYPYGWSHCCDKQLSSILSQYAETHHGKFPAGQSSPEASLSLLYREGLATPNLLRGKTIPEANVTPILDRNDLLSPDTCGWNYVEELTLADDPRLALFWDKVGLGHFGERLQDGGHVVFFVNGYHEYIRGSDWSTFSSGRNNCTLHVT